MSEWRKSRENGLPDEARSPESGHQMAAEGMPFPWRWNGGTISTDLDVIWGMSVKEGKNAIKWTRLSCQKFRNNEVRLQLHTLAYNLGNFMRTLTPPRAMGHWSLTTLREKLIKIGAKIVRQTQAACP